jgi:hypothetical protein
MEETPRKPKIGDLKVDATAIADYAVDLEVGDLVGIRREQPGLDEVLEEILNNHAIYGARGGVTDEDIRRLGLLNSRVDETRTYLKPGRKMVEILEETEAHNDDARHTLISAIASSVERRAKLPGNEDLLGRYEKTRNYRSATAIKAVKTRLKNAQAENPTPDEGKPAPIEDKPAPTGRKSKRARSKATPAKGQPTPGT